VAQENHGTERDSDEGKRDGCKRAEARVLGKDTNEKANGREGAERTKMRRTDNRIKRRQQRKKNGNLNKQTGVQQRSLEGRGG